MVKGTYYGTASDLDGRYKISNISPGSYDVEISMIGYKIILMDLSVKKNIPHLASNAIIPIAVLVVSMFYFVFSCGEGSTLIVIVGSCYSFSALMVSSLLCAITDDVLSETDKSIVSSIESLIETTEELPVQIKSIL